MTTAPFLPAVAVPERIRWADTVLALGSQKIRMTLLSDGEAVVGAYFGDPPARAGRGNAEFVYDPGSLRAAIEQLGAYAAGESESFDLALRPIGTPFQIEVWRSLAGIAFGTTTTYGRIAAEVHRPTGSRAVGAAVGANPIAIVIPCHRVIGANGSLTGFAGGLDNKIALLRLEGVTAV